MPYSLMLQLVLTGLWLHHACQRQHSLRSKAASGGILLTLWYISAWLPPIAWLLLQLSLGLYLIAVGRLLSDNAR